MLLHNLYDNQKTVVRTEHGETIFFPIEKCVRQGCVLSPMLFNLYAGRVKRDAELDETGEGIRIGGRTLNHLQHADDVTLAAESVAVYDSHLLDWNHYYQNGSNNKRKS